MPKDESAEPIHLDPTSQVSRHDLGPGSILEFRFAQTQGSEFMCEGDVVVAVIYPARQVFLKFVFLNFLSFFLFLVFSSLFVHPLIHSFAVW